MQGAVNPDEFYVYKPALRAGKHAIAAPQPRRQGHQDGLWRAEGSAERVQTVDVPQAERQRFCLNDADLVELARQALIIEEHYKRPMDIEWARDGATGDDLSSCRRARRPCRAVPGRTIQRYALKRTLEGARHRPQHRPAHRRGPRARHPRRQRDGDACSPGTCWSPT